MIFPEVQSPPTSLETVSRLQRSLSDADFKAATKRGAVMSALDANEFALAEIERVLPTARSFLGQSGSVKVGPPEQPGIGLPQYGVVRT